MQPSAALEASVPLAPPVTPLARAGKPRARLRLRGIDRRALVTCVETMRLRHTAMLCGIQPRRLSASRAELVQAEG